MLALIRYVTLRSRGNMGGMQVTLKHSYYAVAITVSLVAVLNAPNFLNYKVNEVPLNETCSELDPKFWHSSAYLPGIADIAKANSCLVSSRRHFLNEFFFFQVFRLSYWISGLVFKLLPCALLSLFVWLLLRILREVRENRQRLLKNSSQHRPPTQTTRNGQRLSISVAGNEKLGRNGSLRGRGERVDRTTHMLLAIVAVMLMTELPQGIMAVLSGMLSEEFRISIYNNLGDILDLFSLCGSCCSFIIYCSMSGQFRNVSNSRKGLTFPPFIIPFHLPGIQPSVCADQNQVSSDELTIHQKAFWRLQYHQDDVSEAEWEDEWKWESSKWI